MILCFEDETVYGVWSKRTLLLVLGHLKPFIHPVVHKPIFSCIQFQVVAADCKMLGLK